MEFDRIYIPTGRLDQTIAYYTDGLGFKVILRWSEKGHRTAMLKRDDVIFVFGEGESLAPMKTMNFHIRVDDLEELADEFRSKNVEIIGDIETVHRGSKRLHVREPNGFLITFEQPLTNKQS